MAEFPGFTIWTDAYFADTRHLDMAAHGAYLQLLMIMWRAGGKLPNDEALLARYVAASPSQWAKVRASVMPFFTVVGDQITQGRLQDELERARARSKKQSENARAKYRKNNDVDEAMGEPKDSQKPPTTSTSIDNKKKEPAVPKKGTRIPDDFRPDLEWSQSQGLTNRELKFEFEQFTDYWRSATGQNASKLDWQATWRTWIRKRVKDNGKKSKGETVGQYAYRTMMENKADGPGNRGAAGLFDEGEQGPNQAGLSLLIDLANGKD